MTLSRRWKIVIFLIAGLVGASLVAVVLCIGFLKYRESRVLEHMTTQERAAFEQWYVRPLSIPTGELILQPFDSGLMTALTALRAQWEQQADAAKEINSLWPCRDSDMPLPHEFIQQRAGETAQFKPLFEAFDAVVSEPAYALDVWTSDLWRTNQAKDDWMILQSTLRLLSLDAMGKSQVADKEAAFARMETLLKFARGSRYDSILMKGIAMQALQLALPIWEGISPAAPELKSRLLADLQPFRNQILGITSDGMNPFVIDQISMTSEARRSGIKTKFAGLTGADVMRESLRVQQEYWKQVGVSEAKTSEEAASIQNDIAMVDKQLSAFGITDIPVLGGFIDRLNSTVIFSVAYPALQKMTEKVETAVAKWNAILAP